MSKVIESGKNKICEINQLDDLTEHKKDKSRIATLELELRNSIKCNDVLMTKFMKSENEYLRILKDLNHANSRIKQLEQDLKFSSKNSLKANNSFQRESIFVSRSSHPNRKKVVTCHHCGKKGYIRPFCYELLRNHEGDFHHRDNGRFNLGRPIKTSLKS